MSAHRTVSTHRTVFIWASLASLFIAASAANAEDRSYSALLERIESLEAQQAGQNSQFASYSLSDEVHEHDVCGSCQASSGCGCSGPAWFANYEATVLRPYVSDHFTGPGYDNAYGVGHRFVLGRNGGAGMGVRARYWMYNHGHAGDGFLAGAGLDINMDVIDIEGALYDELRNCDIVFSGGVRYGRADLNDNGTVNGAHVFEGVGPTFSLEALHAVGSRGLYVLGNFRGSLLVGQVDLDGAHDSQDDLTTVLENQLGIGWRGETAIGDLDVRAAWESQFWLNEAISTDTGSNLGFSGPAVSVAVRR